jgi:hypothetical protein
MTQFEIKLMWYQSRQRQLWRVGLQALNSILFLYVVLPAAMKTPSIWTSIKQPIGTLDPGESVGVSGKQQKIGVLQESCIMQLEVLFTNSRLV